MAKDYFGEDGPLANMAPLFDPALDHTLTTRTPPKMVLTSVRLGLISAAINPHRTEPLIDTFVRLFDNRMISYKGEGRLEWLAAIKAGTETEPIDQAEF